MFLRPRRSLVPRASNERAIHAPFLRSQARHVDDDDDLRREDPLLPQLSAVTRSPSPPSSRLTLTRRDGVLCTAGKTGGLRRTWPPRGVRRAASARTTNQMVKEIGHRRARESTQAGWPREISDTRTAGRARRARRGERRRPVGHGSRETAAGSRGGLTGGGRGRLRGRETLRIDFRPAGPLSGARHLFASAAAAAAEAFPAAIYPVSS